MNGTTTDPLPQGDMEMAFDDYQYIKVKVEDGVGEVIFAREPLNVLNIAMMKEINISQNIILFTSRSELKIIMKANIRLEDLSII